MARIRFFIVDAFADRPMAGNPAVIVPEAEGLSDREMHAVAGELRMETGFVLPPSPAREGSDVADVRIRFFSPGAEVAVSGHVTVAAYAALQAMGRLPGAAGPSGHRVRQEAKAGILDVELSFEDGAGPWVTLDFGRPVFGAALDRREVLDALRVGEPAAARAPAPRVVTCGVALAVAAMVDARGLQAAVPDMAALAAFSRRQRCLGVVAYARPGVHPMSALTARFFFPVVGPDEDPVSGAALAAACAYAVRERQLPCVGDATFQTDQGHSLGRPSRAHVTVKTEGGQIQDVRVRGRGVVVGSGELAT